MKKARNILNLILVLSIVAAGLPVYHPMDITRDDKIDLKDAIVHVQGVVISAENPNVFGESLEKAITTLLVTAGLKTVIRPAKNKAVSDGYGASHNFYIIETAYNPFITEGALIEEVKVSPLKSISHKPLNPPPRSIAC